MCQLRRYLYSSLASRRYRTLSLQRMRTVSQDEWWTEQTITEATETPGEDFFYLFISRK